MHVERRVESYLADLVFSHNLAPLRLCGRISLSDWEREEKPAAFPDFAFKPNLAAVHFHELLRQRKPQAGALRLSGLAARLLKFKKDSFLIFYRNSRTRVTHFDARASVLSACPHPNPPSVRRELDCVSDEVQKHLLDSGSIHWKSPHTFIAVNPKVDRFLCRQRSHRVGNRHN